MGFFGMLNKGKHDTRICLIEQSIIDFKGLMQQTLTSLEDLKDHIDESKKENWDAIDKVKQEILVSMDDKYETKIDMNESMTKMRASIITEIEDKQEKRLSVSFRGVTIAVGLITTTAVSCLWVYQNILSKIGG